MQSGGGPRWRTVDSPWRDGTSDCRLRVLFPFLFSHFGPDRVFRFVFLFCGCPSVAETRMNATWRNRLLICILHRRRFITISMHSKQHDTFNKNRFWFFAHKKNIYERITTVKTSINVGGPLDGAPRQNRETRTAHSIECGQLINSHDRLRSETRIYHNRWWIDNETIRN